MKVGTRVKLIELDPLSGAVLGEKGTIIPNNWDGEFLTHRELNPSEDSDIWPNVSVDFDTTGRQIVLVCCLKRIHVKKVKVEENQ
jgi:hypothetical protein